MKKTGIFLSRQLATGFSVGRIPFAPGTFGTIPGLLIWYFLPANPILYLSLIAFLWIASMPGIRSLIDESGNSDPGIVVIDETLGFLTAALFHPKTSFTAISLFILFRFFDILKPWPVSRADRKVGPIYVVLDDIIAGIYTSLIYGLVVSRLYRLLMG